MLFARFAAVSASNMERINPVHNVGDVRNVRVGIVNICAVFKPTKLCSFS